eukprot:Protomagalhaensia_wolfi_Nauph_80__4558@NODE_468_length_2469_cov_334_128807_g352_i0_p1_GENE_NODE_468_length_2469_cov_334_128807_g352_i0NODE_468_length_2469_cov_334_128807_g352_i0_p1_ORF_typecomplete_len396_score67_533Beta_HSD/PF01073_19/7_5e46Epimerase/PF01370_21/1_6e44NAD_binding_10/PF13460_6/1_2e18NmrA/PF05368_13/5_7e14NmrA/PF05368_13/10GDP_Man_Dehyd/PF16363_5/5e16NAD_binding_4/PF07993_12/6e15RmlD_sub_bind/PF04321_17/1_1e06Polysacc_synt_2/PF02719_15/7_8e06Polysacc_synt_2/PF02719_15/5_4e03adh_sh
MSVETVASLTSMSSEHPVLVTGAGGWVGSHCVWQLLEKGYHVRGTVRRLDDPKYEFLKTFHPRAATHLTLVVADLLEPAGWDEAVKGCESILHVASPFFFAYKHESELIKPAVGGVTNVYEAAFRNGVKRIVHTSSVVAVVYGHPVARYRELSDGSVSSGTPTKETFKLFTEEVWSNPDHIVGYEKSKTLAEQKAWELVNKHNEEHPDQQIALTTVLPGFVFGPIFAKAHKAGESSIQIIRIMEKTYPFVPPLNSAHVDVRDVALMHIMAMEAPIEKVRNERFLCTADDGNLTFVEQAKLLAKHVKPWGFNPATTIAPGFLIAVGKYVLSSVKAAADKTHCVTYTSNEKAKRVLGIKAFRPTEDALLAHALTLMKYDVLSKRKTPQEVIDNFKPY